MAQQDLSLLAPAPPARTKRDDFISALTEVADEEETLATALSRVGQRAYNAIRECRSLGSMAANCAIRMSSENGGPA